jgi:hypothetical protein
LLEERCFADCSGLCSVTFDSISNLKKMDHYVFSGCELLTSLCISASLTVLSYLSLDGLESLTVLTFERNSKLPKIGQQAVGGCSSLKSICLPASVEVLGLYCFCSLIELSLFTFEPGSKLWYRIARTVPQNCRDVPRDVHILHSNCY